MLCIAVLASVVPAAEAQEIPGRRLTDIYLVAQFQDGYWSWYHEYLQQRDQQRQRTTEIRMQLSIIAAESDKLHAEWLRYLYLENQLTPASEYDPGWGPYWQAFLGVDSAGELAGEVRREIDDIASRWSAGVWGAPLDAEVLDGSIAGAQLQASYQGERDLRRTQINQWKDKQRTLIDEAERLNRDLLSSGRQQKEKSGGRRPWLNAEVQRLEDEWPVLQVQLYDAARWYLPNELPALIARLDIDNRATETVAALLRAKLYLARASTDEERIWLQMTSPRQAPPDGVLTMASRTARLEAILQLRNVLRLDPENAEARGMLMQVELWWLREIASKLDLERRASLEAFRQYITARGFYADQPTDWSQDLFEIATALWGLGPIALTAGLPGLDVAGARATELDVTQTDAAKHQVTLLSIMRLVKNGVPLAEVPLLSEAQLAEKMTLHTADGRELPADKARRLALDVRQTFAELADLRRLADTDPERFVEDVNLAFGAGYYAPLDPTYTWYESFGDLLNVHNVAFLWGPGSIVRMNGELASVGMLSSAEIQAAERAGQLLTGRQAFLGLTRLDRLAETVAETSVGARWANALAADRAARQGMSAISTVADLGVRLSSAMILYGGATYLAERAGIPGAAILIELLGEIGPGELLSDVMVRAGVPLESVGSKLDDFTRLLVREREELAAVRRHLDEISELTEELAAETLPVTRQAEIRQRLSQIVAEVDERAVTRSASVDAGSVDALAPTASASVADPAYAATKSASEALQNGNVAEARAAAAAGAEMVEEAGQHVDIAYRATVDAVGAVNGAAAGGPVFRITPPERMPNVEDIYATGVDKFWRSDLYSPTGPGRSLQLGDEAIRRGDLAAAAEHFRAARRELHAAGDPASLAAQLGHAESRLDLVVNAQRTGDDLAALRAAIPPSNAAQPIDEAAASQVLDNLDAELTAGTARNTGGANPVFLTRDNAGNAYYVKRIVPEPGNSLTENLTPEDIDRILASEAASAMLAQRVGLRSAGARFDPDRGVLITRAIPTDSAIAGTLASRPEHVAFALRQDYAKQRIFRAWLGDSDGHLRNMLLADDGQLYLFDFDLTVLSGTTSRHFGGADFDTEEDLMRQIVVQFQYVSRDNDRAAMYRYMARMDQTIRYDDVRETVAAIQELANNPAELRRILAESGYPDVDGAVQSLTERASKLEEVFQPMFDSELQFYTSELDLGDPAQDGSLVPFGGGGAWALRIHPATLREAA